MEQLIDSIFSNPLYLIFAVIIIVVLGFSILKKVLKLFLYAIVIFIIYMAYVYIVG